MAPPYSFGHAHSLPHSRVAVGGSFTPVQLSDLALWLDAQDTATLFKTIAGSVLAANGETVERWADKSGNARHCDQGTAGSRPTRSTAINSKSSLTFDGADHLDSPAFATNQPVTVYLAVIYTTSSLKYAFDSMTGDRTAVYGATAAYLAMYAGSAFTHAIDPVTARSFCGVFNGASSVNRIDATEVTGNPGAGGDTTGVRIGGHGSIAGTHDLIGSLGEVIVVGHASDATERATVYTYLKNRWGTP